MPKLNLQLFADSGTDGAGATANVGGSESTAKVSTTENKDIPLSEFKFGIQDDDADELSNQNAEGQQKAEKKKSYRELLDENEDYKTAHDKDIEKAVKRRIKANGKAEERLNKLSPALRYLSEAFGVDINDYDAMSKAAENGMDELFKNKAMETGNDEELIKKESEERFHRNVIQQQLDAIKAERAVDKWAEKMMPQIDECKQAYSDFEFENEMKNPIFAALCKNGVKVIDAYEATHHKDLMTGMLKANTEDITNKMANKMASRQNRPQENGMSNGSDSTIIRSPKNLTKSQRKEIKERVRRGEKIKW